MNPPVPAPNPVDPDGGGGLTVVRHAFDHTQAATLAAGVNVYTPTVGDILYDAWFEVATAFSGTADQAYADIGSFVGGPTFGLFYGATSSIPMTQGDDKGATYGGTGLETNISQLNFSLLAGQGIFLAGQNKGYRTCPATFTATHPLKLVVSQEGTIGGTPITSTAGAATLVVVVIPAT